MHLTSYSMENVLFKMNLDLTEIPYQKEMNYSLNLEKPIDNIKL